MQWWIYKCNVAVWGNWDNYFNGPSSERARQGRFRHCKNSSRATWRSRIKRIEMNWSALRGSNRFASGGQFLELHLQEVERIGTTVRPLKRNPKIAAIEALTSVARRTLHPMKASEAHTLRVPSANSVTSVPNPSATLSSERLTGKSPDRWPAVARGPQASWSVASAIRRCRPRWTLDTTLPPILSTQQAGSRPVSFH